MGVVGRRALASQRTRLTDVLEKRAQDSFAMRVPFTSATVLRRPCAVIAIYLSGWASRELQVALGRRSPYCCQRSFALEISSWLPKATNRTEHHLLALCLWTLWRTCMRGSPASNASLSRSVSVGRASDP